MNCGAEPSSRLKAALAAAAARPATPAERQRQLVSLVYGTVRLDEERMTRAAAEDAVRLVLGNPHGFA